MHKCFKTLPLHLTENTWNNFQNTYRNINHAIKLHIYMHIFSQSFFQIFPHHLCNVPKSWYSKTIIVCLTPTDYKWKPSMNIYNVSRDSRDAASKILYQLSFIAWRWHESKLPSLILAYHHDLKQTNALHQDINKTCTKYWNFTLAAWLEAFS